MQCAGVSPAAAVQLNESSSTADTGSPISDRPIGAESCADVQAASVNREVAGVVCADAGICRTGVASRTSALATSRACRLHAPNGQPNFIVCIFEFPL
jgi:hypothetical protein